MIRQTSGRFSLALALLVLGSLRWPVAAQAATDWTVSAATPSNPASCNSGLRYKTIQAALNCAASSGIPAATITVAPGIYREHLSFVSSLPNFAVTLQGAGEGTDAASSTIIDGFGTGTAIAIGAIPVYASSCHLTVNIRAVRIAGGSNPPDSLGGGGVMNCGVLTLLDTAVSKNTAQNGAGIFNYGTVTLIHSTISNNIAQDPHGGTYNCGGGIFSYGSVTLIQSTISGNSVVGDCGAGGIENVRGTVRMTDSTVSNNSGPTESGGITNSGGTLTLINSTISGNIQDNTSGTGGGGGIDNTGSAMLIGTTVSGNTASGVGGGLTNFGTLTLTNSTIRANTSRSYGGGIDNFGTVSVSGNSAIALNSSSALSPAGGGIYNQAAVHLTNSSAVIGNRPDNCVDSSTGAGC